jgi:hypothetical protein
MFIHNTSFHPSRRPMKEELCIEIDKDDEIPKDFKKSLKKVIDDTNKVTASKIEKILYPEDDL